MKLVKSSYEIWNQQPDLDGIYKQIERAGRICYRSESNITEESARPFVDMLINSEHYSVLEHGTVYLKVPLSVFNDLDESIIYKPWNSFFYHLSNVIFLTTNYRWIIENHLEDWLQYICKPTEYHEKRVTVHFILSRSIAQEFTRHRMFSYSMESQRYCNYSKDKFGNEITFILPPWVDELQLGEQNSKELITQIGNLKNPSYFPQELSELYFLSSLASSELQYFNLLHKGWKPQQAREVLPNACKTELVMTGFISQWKDFFRQRDDSKAHPQAREYKVLSVPTLLVFENEKLIKEKKGLMSKSELINFINEN